jgi:hypothetical protein
VAAVAIRVILVCATNRRRRFQLEAPPRPRPILSQ